MKMMMMMMSLTERNLKVDNNKTIDIYANLVNAENNEGGGFE